MEKVLEGSKTLETLTLNDTGVTLPKEFCRHLKIGIGRSTLSKSDLNFASINWDCPIDGRLVYVSHVV